MKNLCKLLDGTYFEVEDITLWSLDAFCENEAAAMALCDKITSDNVSTIEFHTQYEDGTPNELIMSYEDVLIANLPSRTTMGDGRVLVHMSFSVPNSVEKNVETNSMDITDIQMALAEIYEILDQLLA